MLTGELASLLEKLAWPSVCELLGDGAKDALADAESDPDDDGVSGAETDCEAVALEAGTSVRVCQ